MSFHVRKSMCILEILFLLYDIERTTDHFFMDIGDIDTDKPERHKHDSYHDRIDHDDDTNIRKSKIRESHLIDKLEKEGNPSEKYDKKSHISDEL